VTEEDKKWRLEAYDPAEWQVCVALWVFMDKHLWAEIAQLCCFAEVLNEHVWSDVDWTTNRIRQHNWRWAKLLRAGVTASWQKDFHHAVPGTCTLFSLLCFHNLNFWYSLFLVGPALSLDASALSLVDSALPFTLLLPSICFTGTIGWHSAI
jgi:hypothetical protein